MEVPLRRSRVAEFVGDPAIERVGPGADHALFRGHGEIDGVVRLAEGPYLRFVMRLLAAEIVRRHAEHDQPAVPVTLPQRLQIAVLGGESAERSRVDDQNRPPGIVGHRQRAAVDGGEVEPVRRPRPRRHGQTPEGRETQQKTGRCAHFSISLAFRQPRSRIRRALSRCQPRSLMRSRLSRRVRPRATPSSILARPARLK